MERLKIQPRHDWQDTAQSYGFGFHTMYGEPYWVEDACFSFTLEQIENDIEDPSDELHQMCLDLVEDVIDSEEQLTRLRIPKSMWNVVRDSWKRRDPSLYGRFDLAYSGDGPAKLLEYNADTPTSLYESAFFQWIWLEQAIERGLIPAESDQFNSIQDLLVDKMREIEADCIFHFACWTESEEDKGTVTYLMDCAAQAGHAVEMLDVTQVGIDPSGRFTDTRDRVIDRLFKLYPWEWLLDEPFSEYLGKSKTQFFEPPWKAILSNKAILPLLWQKHKGHPNLLPTFFEGDDDISDQFNLVRKPVFSREGANIEFQFGNSENQSEFQTDGPYGDEGFIVQEYTPLPKFDGGYAVVGSWIVGDKACGMGLREDDSRITQNLSRFLPHIIV